MSRLKNDDGAVAVLVALLMVVIMGFGVLVVDVGSWYAEGRQLQNGAQAGAVAVVQGCVKDSTCTAATGRAGTFANLNANDTRAEVTEVCGGNGAPGLGPCSSSARALYDCRGVPAAPGAPYVQVRTRTLTAGGGARVPPLLIRALQPGNPGKTVTACARAAYGGPAMLTSEIPLTMSYCEFKHYVGDPAVNFAPAPPSQPSPLVAPAPGFPAYGPPANWEKTLYFKYTGSTTTPAATECGTDPKNGPGAFGWLHASGCTVTGTVAGQLPSDSGASPTNCSVADLRKVVGKEISFPVYDEYLDKGVKQYVVKGFASFVLTGFWLESGKSKGAFQQESIVTGKFPCGQDPGYKDEKCVTGFFTKPLTPVNAAIGGPSFGVTAMQVIG